jgi:acetyl-CoA carboxylase biotin carboxyl carrier protein
MKVMNPIPAHRSGKVKEILVQGSDPLEFGQPIMVIE